MQGTVAKSMGLWYRVELPNGASFDCRLKGKFKLQDKKITNPVAVGDRVELMDEGGESETKVITQILPRTNYIIRSSPKKKGHSHLIASNIDLAMLIVTASYPKTSWGFVDRFLVTAEAFRIPAFILCNKMDLLTEEESHLLKAKMDEYKALGYRVDYISALNAQDVRRVLQALKRQTTLVAGHSGVGKSTLINQILPEVCQKTSEVSDFSEKGMHTTTFAERFSIDADTFIIDTPGIKELGLAEIEAEELAHYFPELREGLGKCKFNDCTHTHEPGCSIIQAYKDEAISQSRYESYLSMLSGHDNRR